MNTNNDAPFGSRSIRHNARDVQRRVAVAVRLAHFEAIAFDDVRHSRVHALLHGQMQFGGVGSTLQHTFHFFTQLFQLFRHREEF